MPPPPTFPLIIVADTGINRANTFWSQRIGKSGIITDTASDGMVDVVVGDQVVEGVLPERFTLLDVVHPTALKNWVVDKFNPVYDTLIVIGCLVVIGAAVTLIALVVK